MIQFYSIVRKFAKEKGEQVIIDFLKIVATKALESDHYKDYIKAAGIFEGAWYALGWNEKLTRKEIVAGFVDRKTSANKVKILLEDFLRTSDHKILIKPFMVSIFFEAKYCQADDYWCEKKQHGIMYFWQFCTHGIKQIDKMFNGEGKNYYF